MIGFSSILVKDSIRRGRPFDEIMNAIDRDHIDLVIMPAHQEGHLEHFFASSDADKIVSRLPCSVLLLKEDEMRLKE